MEQIFFLNRPEVANALDLETALNLKKELAQAVKNGSTYFIIASQWPHVFCSGGDLRNYSKLKSKLAGVKVNRKIQEILESFRKLPIFIVAAIDGDTVGGGCELALSCDFIFASRKARFAFKQVKLGLTPGWGGAEKLLHRVGQSTFLDWLSSGRWISSDEAMAKSLIDHHTENGQVLDQIREHFKAHTLKPEMIQHLKSLAYEKKEK